MGSHKDPVVVLGLGRFGSALALELAAGGTEVVAVDSRPAVVQRHSGRLSHVVLADSTDIGALREIGLPSFQRAVVAIGTDVEASILTTALLVDLGVADIWAKAVSAQHAKILSRVGAHHVVRPEHDMGERVAHLVFGRMLDYLEVDEDWALARARPPQQLVGVPLGQSGLRSRWGVTVVSVKPARDRRFGAAGTSTVLGIDDQILIAGRPEDLERFMDQT